MNDEARRHTAATLFPFVLDESARRYWMSKVYKPLDKHTSAYQKCLDIQKKLNDCKENW